MNPSIRHLPAVDRVLKTPVAVELVETNGRSAVTRWIREALDDMRRGADHNGDFDAEQAVETVTAAIVARASRQRHKRLQPVINATGVLLHTNLGRAPLADAAIEAMNQAARATNVELDLESGERGVRGAAVESLCRSLTGAQAALVVNNCAAATLLTLRVLAAGRRVVISRGQLIEIGGSYRLPDIFQEAGVTLHEVGTTNRTRLADYEAAIGPDTAALMRVHPSNYRITGFTESVPIGPLGSLAHQHNLIAIDDIGSGCLYDLAPYGLRDEPIVAESVTSGADLTLFSGDKLLGGPQCGIILGRKSLLDRLRARPLARALRVDKLTLAALQATLEIHQAGRAFEQIPVLQQLATPADAIRGRCQRIIDQINGRSESPITFSIKPVKSTVGGGAVAGQVLPSFALALQAPNINQIAAQLRCGDPPIIGRISSGTLLLDLRTVVPVEEPALIGNLRKISV